MLYFKRVYYHATSHAPCWKLQLSGEGLLNICVTTHISQILNIQLMCTYTHKSNPKYQKVTISQILPGYICGILKKKSFCFEITAKMANTTGTEQNKKIKALHVRFCLQSISRWIQRKVGFTSIYWILKTDKYLQSYRNFFFVFLEFENAAKMAKTAKIN